MQAGEFIKKLLPAFFFSAVLLAFSTDFQKDFHAPKFFLFQAGVLVCFLVFAVELVFKKKAEAAKSILPVFALLFLLMVLISSLESPVPLLSQEKFFWYLAWIGFLLIVCLFNLDLQVINLSFFIFEAAAVPVLLYGFIQHFGLDPIHWNPGGVRIFSTLGNADQLGTFLAAVMAISIIKFIEKPKVLRFFLIESELAALFWSYTRAPFISLFLLFGILLLVGFGVPAFKKIFTPLFLLAVCMGFTLLFLFFANRSTTAGKRFLPTIIHKSPGVIGRLFLLKKGVEVLALHPFSGVGPGNFSYAYLPLTRKEPSFYRNRLAVAESTHNEFLDVFDETGLPGGLFFLSLWMISMIQALNGIETCEEKEAFTRLIIFGVLFSAFISLQFLYFDSPLGALIAYCLGVSISFSKRSVKLSLTRKEAGLIFAVVVVTALFWGGYAARIFIGDFYYHSGTVGMQEKNWRRAANGFSKASAWDPWNPFLYDRLGKVYEASGQPGFALKNYSRAILILKNDPYFWSDLGRLASENNWKYLALKAYEQAFKLDPYNPFICHDAALSALQFKAYQLSYHYAEDARKLDPNNLSDLYYLIVSLSKMGRKKAALHYLRLYRFLGKK